MSLVKIKKTLQRRKNAKKAQILQKFFKTGPGEYAEGDIFIGIQVPVIRKIAKQYSDLDMHSTVLLLKSPIHEERLLARLILIFKYRKEKWEGKERIYKLYLDHTSYINNWDLVDVTAKHIIGDFLARQSKTKLYTLAKSTSLWERRIAILSTFHFIEHHEFEDALKIAAILLADPHDLIHKAVGWMLREVGKRNRRKEEAFLKKYCRSMPRTMLRYAIERFPESKRQIYLKRPGRQLKNEND